MPTERTEKAPDPQLHYAVVVDLIKLAIKMAMTLNAPYDAQYVTIALQEALEEAKHALKDCQ